jgi:hypothetical protein
MQPEMPSRPEPAGDGGSGTEWQDALCHQAGLDHWIQVGPDQGVSVPFSRHAGMQGWRGRANSHSARRRGWPFRLIAACCFRLRAIVPTRPATGPPQPPGHRRISSKSRLRGHLVHASTVSALDIASPPALRPSECGPRTRDFVPGFLCNQVWGWSLWPCGSPPRTHASSAPHAAGEKGPGMTNAEARWRFVDADGTEPIGVPAGPVRATNVDALVPTVCDGLGTGQGGPEPAPWPPAEKSRHSGGGRK